MTCECDNVVINYKMRMTPMRWRYMARKFWRAAMVMRKWPGWEKTAMELTKWAAECSARARDTVSRGCGENIPSED
jgi:hypothetical protein